MKPVKISVQEMYNQSKASYDAFVSTLDRSLSPRSPDVLYDKFGDLGPGLDCVVLDLGCRHAVQACELHRRFGCTVMGFDLVRANIQEAKKRIEGQGLGHSVQVWEGDAHQLPLDDAMFDYIWCRDVLGHMHDLGRVFSECSRVLKPGGKMLIFKMLATELLTDEEAVELWLPTATVPETMSRVFFEQAFIQAGFSVIEADELSSEWREYGEETNSRITSKQLLRIARLRRNREQYVAAFGEKRYACELANCKMGVYQMLGKLSPIIYSLQRNNN